MGFRRVEPTEDERTDDAMLEAIHEAEAKETERAKRERTEASAANRTAPSLARNRTTGVVTTKAKPADLAGNPLFAGWSPPIPIPDDPEDNEAWIEPRFTSKHVAGRDDPIEVQTGWQTYGGDRLADSPPAIPSAVPRAAGGVLKRIRDAALASTPGAEGVVMEVADKAQLDLFDEWVLKLRVRGVSYGEIARRAGGGITEEQLRLRMVPVFAKLEETTTAETKALQWARLELAMNSMADAVERGDIEAIDMWLKAIERGNKMANLEQEKLTVEIKVVNTATANVITSIVDLVVERLRPLMEGKSIDIIDAVIDDAMDEASTQLELAQRPAQYDPKSGAILP